MFVICESASSIMKRLTSDTRNAISDETWMPASVAYLCKVAPIAKFKCAPLLIIQILNIGTIFTKDKS